MTATTRLAASALALGFAACVEQPAAPPPAAAAAAPSGPPTPSDASIAPGLWDVERVRCTDLLGIADDDRVSAAMFYYGYLAAKVGIRVIDVDSIDANIAKIMRQSAMRGSAELRRAADCRG